jgi:hypothetical protein
LLRILRCSLSLLSYLLRALCRHKMGTGGPGKLLFRVVRLGFFNF